MWMGIFTTLVELLLIVIVLAFFLALAGLVIYVLGWVILSVEKLLIKIVEVLRENKT